MNQIDKEFILPFLNKNFSQLICGFTLPALGNQALTRKSISLNQSTEQNRIMLGKKLNINNNNFFSPHQIHSDIIIEVDKPKIGMGSLNIKNSIQGDACISNLKNVLLIVTWADCIPVLLYDNKDKWIGAIHSGWKGTKQNISGKVLDKLFIKGVKKENLYIAIGPGIRKCCYSVDNKFYENFKEYDKDKFFETRENKLYFDLKKLVLHQILEKGIYRQNIMFIKDCTCCSSDQEYFSYRKHGKNFEAQAAFIGIF